MAYARPFVPRRDEPEDEREGLGCARRAEDHRTDGGDGDFEAFWDAALASLDAFMRAEE